MAYSKYFEKVRKYYSIGVWNISRVRAAVEKEWITEEEFKIITGEDY